MTPDTLADYARNIGPALQDLGYNLRDLDLDALAADLHDSVADPAIDRPAAALRQLGLTASILPQYVTTRRYRVRIPRHGQDVDHYTPQVDGGDTLATRAPFSLSDWLTAVYALEDTAQGIGLDTDGINIPQVLADLLNGTGTAISINEKTPRMLAGHYGLDGLHGALAGGIAPGIGYQGQDGDVAAINFNGAGF